MGMCVCACVWSACVSGREYARVAPLLKLLGASKPHKMRSQIVAAVASIRPLGKIVSHRGGAREDGAAGADQDELSRTCSGRCDAHAPDVGVGCRGAWRAST
jgi:hypothetical protein